MVKYSDDALDALFGALADRTRRGISSRSPAASLP